MSKSNKNVLMLKIAAFAFKFRRLAVWLSLLIIALHCVICVAAPIRIVGLAQYELVNNKDSSTHLIASARLVIVVDGPKYRISTESTMGDSDVTLGYEGKAEEYGCDGIDTFLVTDRATAANKGGGKSGMILPGRFPIHGSGQVQAAWLGYCSDGYFNDPANHTNLALAYMLTWVSPENVTNLVQYWTNSLLPKEIIGWSRNLVKLPNQEPRELKQYPDGWKEWKFVASDDVLIGNTQIPRNLVLEGFVPKPPQTATTGDETTLSRRISFVATSVEIETNLSDSLPTIPLENLPVYYRRFEKQTAPAIQITKVSPATGWPTRSSAAFKVLEADAEGLTHDNVHDFQKAKKSKAMVFIICGANIILIGFIIMAIRKAKLNKNKQKD